MTTPLSCWEISRQIIENVPGSVVETDKDAVVVDSQHILAVATFLKQSPGLDFDYLTAITAVDYYTYFELIYQLVSTKHNHSIVIKTRCYGRDNASLSSVVSLWEGANYQEREIYDLMGITFENHPNLKPIVLWEGFQGHPLRKDYM